MTTQGKIVENTARDATQIHIEFENYRAPVMFAEIPRSPSQPLPTSAPPPASSAYVIPTSGQTPGSPVVLPSTPTGVLPPTVSSGPPPLPQAPPPTFLLPPSHAAPTAPPPVSQGPPMHAAPTAPPSVPAGPSPAEASSPENSANAPTIAKLANRMECASPEAAGRKSLRLRINHLIPFLTL